MKTSDRVLDSLRCKLKDLEINQCGVAGVFQEHAKIATVMMTRFHLTQKEGPAAQWLWRLLESPLSNESLPEGRGLWYVHLMPEVTTNSGHRSCSTRRSRQASTLVLKDTPWFQCQLKGLL